MSTLPRDPEDSLVETITQAINLIATSPGASYENILERLGLLNQFIESAIEGVFEKSKGRGNINPLPKPSKEV